MLELLYKFHVAPTAQFGTTVTRVHSVRFNCNTYWRSAQGKLTVADMSTMFTPQSSGVHFDYKHAESL